MLVLVIPKAAVSPRNLLSARSAQSPAPRIGGVILSAAVLQAERRISHSSEAGTRRVPLRTYWAVMSFASGPGGERLT
jgi:hypothetical protein